MNLSDVKIEYDALKSIAREAGEAILTIYQKEDFSVITDFKADNSPLTLADKESHNIISRRLEKLFPDIPVLSEEGKDISFDERRHWSRFWLVDPLDGTKEFINRNGEFTVNIALIENNKPIMGLIYIPVQHVFYFGKKGEEAFKEDTTTRTSLKTSLKTKELKAVGSRSHSSKEEQDFLRKMNVTELVSKGSSLKFCMIAEGNADVYFRFGPTMEWDTAAGQAIVEAAGGSVLDSEKNIFSYNKQSLRNGSFYCLSNQDLVKMVK